MVLERQRRYTLALLIAVYLVVLLASPVLANSFGVTSWLWIGGGDSSQWISSGQTGSFDIHSISEDGWTSLRGMMSILPYVFAAITILSALALGMLVGGPVGIILAVIGAIVGIVGTGVIFQALDSIWL